ncbi:MAG: hypothetical protein AABZ78_04215, partial [Chloroflexota bacterium]
ASLALAQRGEPCACPAGRALRLPSGATRYARVRPYILRRYESIYLLARHATENQYTPVANDSKSAWK